MRDRPESMVKDYTPAPPRGVVISQTEVAANFRRLVHEMANADIEAARQRLAAKSKK
jgi:hypothetical protein